MGYGAAAILEASWIIQEEATTKGKDSLILKGE